MKAFRYIVILMIVVIVSSCSKNSAERNTMVFEDEVRNVQDSLIKMMKLLALLPKRSDNLNTNYTIKSGKLYANYGFLKDSIIEVGYPFSQFGASEKKDFTSLAFYLNKNHISSAYYDESSSLWRFIYRDIPDITYNDSRSIVVLSDKEAKSIELTDKVLDKKDNLYLVAPRDAILSACNQKGYIDKREKDMTNNNGYVDNGNSAIDISFKDLDKKTQVLFSNKDVILVGLNNEPYALFAGTKFEISSLPSEISNNLMQIKKVLLKPSLVGNNQINERQSIEPWLANFHKVEYLTLDHIKLKNLNVIQNLPLKYLILNNVALENRSETINEIGNLKTLKYIAHSSLFSPAEIIKIKKDLPDVNILLEADFNRKVEKGEIESD